ncbi:MAG TPA: heme-binding protein [Candidatus Tectomicrobia bacterium]
MARSTGPMVAAILVLVPYAAHPRTLVPERTLALNAAHEVVTAALEQCHKDGSHVTVTVLNRDGRTAVVLHDDGDNPHTIENSLRKAYTSHIPDAFRRIRQTRDEGGL